MIYRDPKCVFVADSLGHAEVIVLFLGDHDIPAQVMNPQTLGGLDGLTWMSRTGVAASGIEVWVLDSAHAKQAHELIAEHAARLAAKEAERGFAGEIEVICEECGKPNVFSGEEAGKVLTCGHCRAHIDVPDTTVESVKASETNACYLCGRRLQAHELASRVCQACSTATKSAEPEKPAKPPRRRTAVDSGMRVGLIVGVVLGALTALGEQGQGLIPKMLGIGLVFALLGGLVGALLGRLRPDHGPTGEVCKMCGVALARSQLRSGLCSPCQARAGPCEVCKICGVTLARSQLQTGLCSACQARTGP